MNTKPHAKKNPEFLWSVLVTLPALFVFIVFTYYPTFSTFFYSFTDWNGFGKQYNFVGLQNFAMLLKDSDVIKVFGNTLFFALISIFCGTLIQLFLAAMLYDKFRGKNFFRAVFYLPCVISPIIVAQTWRAFFQYSGVINSFLQKLGVPSDALIDWLGNVATVKPALAFINTWQWAGYGMVIFLTGLGNISSEVYEAADLDGATGLSRFFSITLPLLMPAITINLFIGITGALKIFDLPYVLTGGGPMKASKTLSMAIYDNAFSYELFGYASAVGFVFFIFIAIVTLIQLKVTRDKEVEL